MKRAIVVGSGAGGAIAARELAAGFDVTVLEAGREFSPFRHDLDRIESLRSSRLFLDPRMIRLLFSAMHVDVVSDGMALVRALATGGTTTIATGNALRCDDELLRRGIDLGDEFDALLEELPVSTAHTKRWRPTTKGMFSACQKLGLDPVVTPKLVDYDRCGRCGRCVLGCPNGAKWDSRRCLEAAADRGAKVLTGANVERVLLENVDSGSGRATGVVFRRRGRREFLAADLVVVAAGGLGTPAILTRSGLPTQGSLFVDPVLCVAAPATGSSVDAEVPMPFYVQGEGYMISPYFDYLSFFFNKAWRRSRHDVVSLMIKLADSEAGVVGPRGRVEKGLTARDRKRLAVATESCVEILTQYGVERDSIFLGTLNAGHPGGTLPLTGTERESLHADDLPPNLYVADASLLPQSLGRPPILTIMALARRISRLCLERLS